MSNYATKTDLKNAAGVDTSSFARKVYLTSWKSNVYKLDIDKLKNLSSSLNSLNSKVDKLGIDKLVTVLVNLSKLNDIVKNDVVKKMYITLRLKILKTKYLILLT